MHLECILRILLYPLSACVNYSLVKWSHHILTDRSTNQSWLKRDLIRTTQKTILVVRCTTAMQHTCVQGLLLVSVEVVGRMLHVSRHSVPETGFLKHCQILRPTSCLRYNHYQIPSQSGHCVTKKCFHPTNIIVLNCHPICGQTWQLIATN